MRIKSILLCYTCISKHYHNLLKSYLLAYSFKVSLAYVAVYTVQLHRKFVRKVIRYSHRCSNKHVLQIRLHVKSA